MGFFNFGNNSKAEIQSCALKISTGLGQIEQEYASSNDGSGIPLQLFTARLNNEAKGVLIQTGIDIGIWL